MSRVRLCVGVTLSSCTLGFIARAWFLGDLGTDAKMSAH